MAKNPQGTLNEAIASFHEGMHQRAQEAREADAQRESNRMAGCPVEDSSSDHAHEIVYDAKTDSMMTICTKSGHALSGPYKGQKIAGFGPKKK